MVRLKAAATVVYCFSTGFQFHYGSVKSLKTLYHRKSLATKFQFHYGSVKSFDINLDDITKKEFQFHYGSVKRHVYTYALILRPHFNSTMVRLKVLCLPSNSSNMYISIPLWFG